MKSVAGEYLWRMSRSKTSFLFKPNRNGEMPKREERFNAPLFECLNHFSVMYKRGFVKFTLFGLYARPFNGKTISILPELFQDIEILFVSIPVIASPSRRRNFALPRRFCPIIIFYAALYLIRS